MYNYIHTEIKTYRHTQTNRQTDSAEVQEGRQKNIQMYSKTIAYLKIDRQTEQTRDFPAPFRPPSPLQEGRRGAMVYKFSISKVLPPSHIPTFVQTDTAELKSIILYIFLGPSVCLSSCRRQAGRDGG